MTDTYEDFAASLDFQLDEVRAVMLNRHLKYGRGNIAAHGELGLLVRLDDKLARLNNSREDFSDESVDDTVLDVVGYGLIWLMWRAGAWPGVGR